MKIIILIAALIFASITTTVVYHKTQQADINYYQGHRLFLKGDFLKAVPFFEKSLAAKPLHLETLRELAYSYQWSGEKDKAIEIFREALKLNPKDPKIKQALAETLSWQGNHQEAIKLYREIIADTGDLEVQFKLAEVYMWAGQPEEAEDILRQLLRKRPKDVKARILFARSLLYSGKNEEAIPIFDALMKESEFRRDKELRLLYGQAFMYSSQYEKAQEIFLELLKEDPGNLAAMESIADIRAYTKDFKAAENMYRQILSIKESAQVKRKLADTLSWDKKYKEAIALYDEILREKEDLSVRLQKARVLGWWRKYPESIREYRKILQAGHNEAVALEMNAKKGYWDNRVKNAIRDYNLLIEKDPRNVEAMFDLSQLYSYQYMWEEAIKEYKKILSLYPNHFRAKEGLEKAELIFKRPSLNSGYEFFEARSTSRDTDIKKHSLVNLARFPLSAHLSLDAAYKFARRSFSDFRDVSENETRLKLTYINNPDWWVDAFYDCIAYYKAISAMHTFGGSFNLRVFDLGVWRFAYERERLENNSLVIQKGYYSDNYRQRLALDINKRLKMGIEYVFARYSDSNYKNEPGFDMSYFLMLEPRRLMLKYKYFYRDFKREAGEYFSPRGFHTNSIGISWRHFLNKEEIFFGADDLYYDLGYEASADSEGIVGHKFSGEFGWDVNKRLNINIKASVVNSSADVYKDKSIVAAVKFYF